MLWILMNLFLWWSNLFSDLYNCFQLRIILWKTMIDDWIDNPTWTFSQGVLYVCYNCSINWLKHIINVTIIDNYFSFCVWIKMIILCFILTFCILNTETNFVRNLKPFIWDKNSSSLLLIAYSVSLSCSPGLKKFKISVL